MNADKGNFALNFVKKFVFGEDIQMSAEPLCYRFLVGSSNVQKMIDGSIGTRDTHGDLFSVKESKGSGFFAENFAEKWFKDWIVLSKPFVISQDFPFLCATPDFILEDLDGALSVLEIKSGDTKANALRYADSQRSRTQVRVAMEILRLAKAKICAIRTFHPLSVCEIVDTLPLKKNFFLFEKREEIIKGYVRYLENFFL